MKIRITQIILIASVFFLLFFSLKVNAQSSNVTIYDLDTPLTIVIDVAPHWDGGYMMACRGGNPGIPYEFFLLRTDPYGNIIFKKTYLRSTNATVVRLKETADGGFLLFHYQNNPTPYNTDYPALMKVDANGDSLWMKLYLDYPINGEYVDVSWTDDGGFIAGFFNSYAPDDIVDLVKVDSDGEIEWEEQILEDPSPYYFGLFTVRPIEDNYVVVFSEEIDDVIIGQVQLFSSSGELLDSYSREASFSGIRSEYPTGFNNSFYLLEVVNADTLIGYRVSRINVDLEEIWHLDIPYEFLETIRTYSVDDAGNLVFVTQSSTVIDDHTMHLFKVSHSGELLWSNTIADDLDLIGAKTKFIPDGRIIISGYYTPDFVSFKGMVSLADQLGNLHYSTLQGNIFYDMNGNDEKDSGEPGIPDLIVQNVPGSLYGVSNENGDYKIHVFDTAEYQISTDTPLYFSLSYPDDFHTVIVDTPYDSINNLDFAFVADELVSDISVHLNNSMLTPGSVNHYQLTINNFGTIAATAPDLNLSIPEFLSIDSSSNIFIDSIVPDLKWSLLDLSPFAEIQVDLYCSSVFDTLWIDSVVTSIASVNSLTEDANILNNTDTLNQIVYSSFDPNIISVSPLPEQPSGFTNPAIETLEYTIEFQNTGNYPAHFVHLENQLPEELQVLSFRMVASSHPYNIELDNSGLINWYFNDIILPDSSENYLESMGFVTYAIDVVPDLSLGTTIINSAEIYFDNNPPVFTNNAITILDTVVGTNVENNFDDKIQLLTLYPNPATSTICWQQENQVQQISIFSLVGELVFFKINIENNCIDITALPQGIYVYRITTGDGMEQQGKIIKSDVW
ncbi:MAG: T9SS type A sorting domain-containing protein [Bacteroidetes bacterium]|nr:T9SS type A sorting domain-containing protein [Bacteroidota bacterium]